MAKRVYVIAEAGVNHNGDLAQAHRLIEAAANAGADAVKFQTFKAESLVSPDTPKADYQKQTTGSNESQLEMIRKLEMPESWHHELKQATEKRGMEFLSTPFDVESARFLAKLGVQTFKVPSGEITHLPLLQEIAYHAKRIIISTGMSELAEVSAALDAMESVGAMRHHITVLHCTTEYPAPFSEVNLKAMLRMREVLQVAIGYSDHTPGIAIPIAAAALGATVIEKHFTLDRNLPGPDHKASLEPQELKEMVLSIRNVEVALGDGEKRVMPSEKKNRDLVRKSIVAACEIAKGQLFSTENLVILRPGTGLSPMHWNEVLGKKANKSYRAYESIDPSSIG